MKNFFRKTICIFVFLLSFSLAFAALAAAKLKVVASIYPMAEFCRAVGGTLIEVVQLVPDGAEPHDYEPSPKDLAGLGKAQVFVYNGIVEPWAESALAALGKTSVINVMAADGLMDINGKQDPHVWVSPRGAMEEVKKIYAAFSKADPKHAEIYRRNAAGYLSELVAIDKEYVALGKGARRTFVTSHGAFGHLAKDYNFKMIPVSGLSPSAEPTPSDLLQVVRLVKEHNVRYVFFETLASPKLASLVAKEAGVKTGVLDPAEGVEPGSKKSYLDLQWQNIDALKQEFAK